jgi:hypothetical protein
LPGRESAIADPRRVENPEVGRFAAARSESLDGSDRSADSA